jgi:hypothetical protein
MGAKVMQMPRVGNKNEKRAHSTLKAAPTVNMVNIKNANYGPGPTSG